ncbi:MAG: DUF1499 domain-containing protein [Gammaproteobacteria bacterium]|nr:MAG: DUF1499 domain-containing protein [Gammaproteobacteria bacterium]
MLHRLAFLLIAAMLSACAASGAVDRDRDGNSDFEPCGTAPRCVVSLDDAGSRRIEPLMYTTSPLLARLHLMQLLVDRDDVEVVTAVDDYIHAVFVTPRLRYRDDVEFLIRNDGRVDVRSSSRIGWYDWGTNRNRIESLRTQLAATSP